MAASLIHASSPLGYRACEEPPAKEPAGVYRHDDARPMLGRKLQGKSQRELAVRGLTVGDDDEIHVDLKLVHPAEPEPIGTGA